MLNFNLVIKDGVVSDLKLIALKGEVTVLIRDGKGECVLDISITGNDRSYINQSLSDSKRLVCDDWRFVREVIRICRITVHGDFSHV